MKKRTMAIILSAVSALTCLSPLSADALGEISSESLESAVSEYYGSEYREWKIYALDDDMKLNVNQLKEFMEVYRGQKILLFGFTFISPVYFPFL